MSSTAQTRSSCWNVCPARVAWFASMFDSVESKLSGKKIGLFGSYGWGDGEWMRQWEDQVRGDGAQLAADPVTAHEAPDDSALSDCRALGRSLA